MQTLHDQNHCDLKAALEIQDVWKQFKLGKNYNYYPSLRDNLLSWISGFGTKSEPESTFWALQAVNVVVNPSETVGIIGRNGAGKTTLLKILSRISPPTKGKVMVRGRLSSLLEVGTGFHPELTGRENVYLNGAILGLTKPEIKHQFDEIVAFSGVEAFLDSPLKHYSTGMQLRLAFSVAAHLKPDILLIDEVLAVGDADFQKKCLQKMDEVSKSGRTILFISHNLQAVRELCQRGIVLDHGKVLFDGTADEAVNFYEGQLTGSLGAVWNNNLDLPSSKVFLQRIEITNRQGHATTSFINSEAVLIQFYLKANQAIAEFSIGFDLIKNGMTVLRTRQLDSCDRDNLATGELLCFTCEIPAWLLNEGLYTIRPDMAIFFKERLSKVHYDLEMAFQVLHDPARSHYHQRLNGQNQPGVIFPSLTWDASLLDTTKP